MYTNYMHDRNSCSLMQTDTNFYIVTERVTPLSWGVRRRSISEETAKWGLYTVAVCLDFLFFFFNVLLSNVAISLQSGSSTRMQHQCTGP